MFALIKISAGKYAITEKGQKVLRLNSEEKCLTKERMMVQSLDKTKTSN